ncbi:cobalamin biosynthesis protein CobD/CbiB [Shewanella acanthi]|uniref:cobalamin biosynthesis protein CobD/CbiB n=1 Tax=Shewanella acanthi TaxID=2864212 RepID=UPI001C657065|nr:cobalamin biosynthesis protein [Shewanella acanthi]QYJ78005.1 cobalamin biosynthesis protein [Shewanella acanthi]
MHSSLFQQLVEIDGALFEGFLVLFFALLLARLAPLPREMQPLIWFAHLAKQLAAKVNRPERGANQQTTAGFLAMLLLVFPFWAIITFLLELAAFPWFFEFLVLYLCLTDSAFSQVADEIAKALKRQDNASAKKLLQPWVVRDTESLSEVGITKATIEKLATAPIYGTAATIFFFALAGAPMVLAVRMLKQLEISWPPIQPQYQYFSRSVNALSTVLLAIPAWLWSLSIAMQGGPTSFSKLFTLPKNHPGVRGYVMSVNMVASILQIELGGPQKLAGQRVEIAKVVYGPQPHFDAIAPAVQLTSRASGIWFGFITLLPILWAGLRYLQSL